MDVGELTAQEKAISEGKSSWTRTSPGFDRLLETIRGLPIRLLVERTRILTRVVPGNGRSTHQSAPCPILEGLCRRDSGFHPSP